MSNTKLKNYDWNQVVNLPKSDALIEKQIINYYSRVSHFNNDTDATLFVEKHLSEAKAFDLDAEVFKFASDQVTVDGEYLEFGVCTGRTINFISALNPRKKVYGFDSFEGLPEKWERPDLVIPMGTFALKDKNFAPPVHRNVELVPGLFSDTLPLFKKDILKDKPIAFIHIDCDLYSSTADVFSNLKDNIIKGTIILFDELYNYPGYEDNEFKALTEFLDYSGKKAEYLAFNQYVGQVVVRIM